MIRSDAWDEKTGTHALTLKVELMHEAEKQGRQHHFLPLSHPAPAHVGAIPPATPYPTVGPRQQGASNLTRRLPMLALSRWQSLNPPSGHANRACPSSQRACPVPEGPLLVALPTLFESKFSREHGHKKRKISPIQQFQPKTKIISIKNSRTFRDKY